MPLLPTVAAAALAFAATAVRYYTTLSSVAFHNTLRLAVKDGNDGVIIAYLDELSPNHPAEIDAFNQAARSWRCVPPGGVHVMLTGEDGRARFLSNDLQQLHQLPYDAVPPIALFFQNERPVAWIAANGSSDAAAVGAVGAEGDHGGSNLNYFFSVAALEDWGHSLFDVQHVRSESDVAAFRRGASAERVAVGFFPSACEDAAAVYHQALASLRSSIGGGGRLGDALSAAVSPNVTLGHELCGLDASRGGVCVMFRDTGARVGLPDQLPYTADDVARWLGDITGGAAVAAAAGPSLQEGKSEL